MAAIPGKPILPFTPTVDQNHNPTVCKICGMRAFGIGVSNMRKTTDDPGYLCVECAVLVEAVRSMRRFDVYELKALDGCVDAVGDFITERGAGTDLAYFDELDQRMLCKRVVMAFGDTLRRLLREESPF